MRYKSLSTRSGADPSVLPVDPKDNASVDKAQKLRIQRERQATAAALARQVTSLLQRTVLNVSVTCQAIHSKNARHMLLGKSAQAGFENTADSCLVDRPYRLSRTDHGDCRIPRSRQAARVGYSLNLSNTRSSCHVLVSCLARHHTTSSKNPVSPSWSPDAD